jgi:hypothetical protein
VSGVRVPSATPHKALRDNMLRKAFLISPEDYIDVGVARVLGAGISPSGLPKDELKWQAKRSCLQLEKSKAVQAGLYPSQCGRCMMTISTPAL